MAEKKGPKKLLITTDDLGVATEGQFFHGQYFRNNYRKIVKINLFLIFIALFLIAGVFLQKIFIVKMGCLIFLKTLVFFCHR